MVRRPILVNVAAYSMLSLAGVASLMLPQSVVPRSMAATAEAAAGYTVWGTARDFRASHVDFAAPAAVAHCAGNLASSLGSNGLPVYTGLGYRVNSEWRDGSARNIAPSMYRVTTGVQPPTCGGVHLDGTMLLKTGAYIDSFNSWLGAYGAGNSHLPTQVSTNLTSAAAATIQATCTVYGDMLCGPGGNPNTAIVNLGTINGTKGALSAGVAIPTVTAPTNAVVGVSTGAVWYNNGAVTTISNNKHYDSLRISGSGTVMKIQGNVTMLIEGVLRTETGGTILVPPGSSLDIYVKGYATIETACQWSNPVNTRMYLLGTSASTIQTNSSFCGTIVAPSSQLVMKTDAALYGSYIGSSLQAETGAAIHVDQAGSGLAGCGGPPPACLVVSDTAGVKGASSAGAITSASSFGDWFIDVMGTNLAMPCSIFLSDIGGGVYEYTTSEFHPVDGVLFGNEGQAHNRDFTYSFLAAFTYHACTGQYFQFDGDDDAWAFVNGGLAMDLGGISPGVTQTIDMDRCGLKDGQAYELLFLFAQRQNGGARFHIKTNLVLTTSPQNCTVSAGVD